jgi:hypothetical protein
MERILFMYFGLNLRLKNDPQSTIDFEHESHFGEAARNCGGSISCSYSLLHFTYGNVVLARASGAISAVLGIAAVAGNTRAYYWLVLLKLLILLIIDG